MRISGSSYSLSNRDDYNTFAKRINEDFKRLKINAADYLKVPQTSQSKLKTNVSISPQILKKASADQNMMDTLESKLSGIAEANNAIAAINKAEGRELVVKGYTIDRNGKVTIHGTDMTSEEEFQIEIGNMKDRNQYKQKIYDYFEVSATSLMIATYKL